MPNAALDPDELAENRLLAQLAEVNINIAKLTAEKAALERLVVRMREKRTRAFDVTRKNSLDRILVEDRIIEIVSRYNTSVNGRYIFNEVISIVQNIRSVTFRSHLHRMKDKGIIKSCTKRGFWILTDQGS